MRFLLSDDSLPESHKAPKYGIKDLDGDHVAGNNRKSTAVDPIGEGTVNIQTRWTNLNPCSSHIILTLQLVQARWQGKTVADFPWARQRQEFAVFVLLTLLLETGCNAFDCQNVPAPASCLRIQTCTEGKISWLLIFNRLDTECITYSGKPVGLHVTRWSRQWDWERNPTKLFQRCNQLPLASSS